MVRWCLYPQVGPAAERPVRWAAGMRELASISALFAVVVISVGAQADSSDKPQVVPQDLHEFALSNHCIPPADFFEMRFEVAPPYVYADGAGPGPLAAALWCQPDPSIRSYTLLFRPGAGDLGLGTCSPAIPNQTHIGGLMLVDPSRVRPASLVEPSAFRPLLDPKAPPLSSPIRESRLLKSESDGAGCYFLCRESTWFFRCFD